MTHFRENTADDTISLVRIDGTFGPQVFEYPGTTESGYFTKDRNTNGDFKMSPGFYFFRRGFHHGKDPCLVQACAVIGRRAQPDCDYDETKSWTIDDTTLHIHAGINNTQNVANWSAGCQVIAGGWGGKAWGEFYGNCDRATNWPLPYVLVEEKTIEGLLA